MKTINVKKNLTINSLSKALEIADENDTIIIYPGIYYEKVKIKKSNLNIFGIDPENTIITNDDYALKIHQDGLEYNTFRTYTMMILANNVRLENLQIVNTSGIGSIVGQAVALSIIGDNIHINNCILDAHQDTLFLGPLPNNLLKRYINFLPKNELVNLINARILIENSKICGDVDFIFGGANAVFNNCVIHSYDQGGYVCAPSTDIHQKFGFTFIKCKFTSNSTKPNTYLARPWRDYGKGVFINCLYDSHIYEEGFNKWDNTSRDKTCRFYEYNSEYVDNREYRRIYFSKSLTNNEAAEYKINNILKLRE